MLTTIKRHLKTVLNSLRRRRSARAQEQNNPHYEIDDLVTCLAELGIAPGDSVFLHSSLRSIGFVVGGAGAVIAALQRAVGEEGNVILPTYYLPGGTIEGTCQLEGYVFDPRIHGTNMGRLPETFLPLPGVHRSLHPTHSVSAWGKDAAFLTDSHHLAPSVFGEGSPWQRFTTLEQPKVLGLGISMGPVTFYHLVEDQLGADFPLAVWAGEYSLPCVDANDRQWQVPVRAYNSELTQRRIDHKSRGDLQAYFRQEFTAAGLLHSGTVGDAASWWIDGREFRDHLAQLAQEGMTIYATPEELAARPHRG